jgi:hypothetical protein
MSNYLGIAITTKYDADGTLSGLATLYGHRAPENKAKPYVVYHLPITGHSIKDRFDRTGEMILVQFGIWSQSEAETDAIFNALTKCFDDATLTYASGYTPWYCTRGEYHGGPDPEGNWFYNVDYMIKVLSGGA